MGRLTRGGSPLDYLGDPLFFGDPDQPEPGLGPLKNSHEADDIERELKEAFIEVFEYVLRAAVKRVDTYGAPHRGDFRVIERFVKHAGLALERRANAEAFMRELFRGWTARNPKRGLHFLRFYLQLLWPNQYELAQLWHGTGAVYPSDATPESGAGRFRTSRVRLYLDVGGGVDSDELAKLQGSFRAVLPARLVLEAATRSVATATLRFGAAVVGVESETITLDAAP